MYVLNEWVYVSFENEITKYVMYKNFQEAFRYGMYVLLRRTEAGLKEISENHNIGRNKMEMAYVSGLGFGIMSGAFALINVLADSVSYLIRPWQ